MFGDRFSLMLVFAGLCLLGLSDGRRQTYGAANYYRTANHHRNGHEHDGVPPYYTGGLPHDDRATDFKPEHLQYGPSHYGHHEPNHHHHEAAEQGRAICPNQVFICTGGPPNFLPETGRICVVMKWMGYENRCIPAYAPIDVARALCPPGSFSAYTVGHYC